MDKRFPILIVVLGLAAVACSSSTNPPDRAGSTGEPSPSATASTPGATTDPRSGGSTTEPEPDETDDGQPSSPAPGGGEGYPTSPPRAGTYTYRQEGETVAGPFTLTPDPQGTLTARRPDGIRQRQIRRYADSPEQSAEQVLLYRSGGVYLHSYESTFATTSVSCTMDEPLLVVDLPLEVGNSWEDDGRCGGMTMSLRGRVSATEDRTVGGTEVETFVLKVIVQTSGDGIEQNTTQTLWVSPEYRLIVRSIEKSNGRAQGQDFTSNRTDELVSLEPR